MPHPSAVRACLAASLCCAGFAGPDAGSGPDHSAAVASALTPQSLANRLATARAPFIANQGQIPDEEVCFYARMLPGVLFVTERSQLVYALPRGDQEQTGLEHAAPVWAFRETFGGGEQSPPRGENASTVHVSHYKGARKQGWKRQLATWDSLSLGEPYPGIHVTLKATGRNVEKLFHVAPGADASAIDVAVEGVDGMSLNDRQELVLATALGDVVFSAPLAYQVRDGERGPVEVAYVLGDGGHYGFRLGEYDREREVVIDPLLASTYIGGHNPAPPGNYDDDIIYGMVVTDGDVYVAGATQSPDFPVHLGYDETLDSAYPDGFVTRMSGDLSTVIASTYIGTEGFDRVADIALDSDGSIIAVGQAGYGFPVTDGAYTWSGTTPVGGGFIARFSADLSTLLASSVATPSNYPVRVALGNGGVYFGGTTNNPNFPITPGAFKDTCCPSSGSFGIREYDGFAGKLSSDLGTLEALTYLGGNVVSGISIAPGGSVFITDGSDNAITGYISRMDAGLTTRSAFLTYYPGSTSGSSRTYFNDVAAGDGFVVTAGQTYMNDLPATRGAFDTACGTDGLCDGIGSLLVPRSDGFVAVYSDDLKQTLALTYLGGSDHESIRSLALDAGGDIYLTGETTSVDFPTTGSGADRTCGKDGQCDPTGIYSPTPDGFVAVLSGDLSQLRFGSYLGGSGEDRPVTIGLDGNGLVYAAGYTRSLDFPTTPGAFDRSYNGGTSDAFVIVGEASAGGGGENEPPTANAGPDQMVRPRQIVTLDGRASFDPDGQIAGHHWTQIYGQNVTMADEGAAVTAFRAPGVRPGVRKVLVFELEVTDDQGASGTDRVRIDVTR